MLRECLVFSSMRLGVPFIAPRQLGAVECIPGRHFLPPGAPDSPVHHRTLSGADLLPYLAKPTVGTWEPLAHQTLSGAPCRPLARSRVSRGSRGRPLAHRTVRCTPESPVNYSRTPLITSREQQVRLSQPGAPDTVRCTTGHCAVLHRTVRCTQIELTLAEQSHL
jgi:hypothetical protein